MTQGTQRLFHDDPYQVAFEARVVEKGMREQKPAVILDQTCFYPESGGQPSDRGWINGAEVLKVFEEGGRIVHILDKDVETESIKGKIDWKTRFDHMQQHSGQHILSQCFHQLLEAETRAFHLGQDISTLEMDLRKVSDEDVERVEKRANQVVCQDREVKIHSLPEGEVASLPLRRPPKKKGIIRVVEVSDFDYSACGGTHVRRTGEVGLIKILRWERIRDNIRFEFICGNRAFQDYMIKSRILRELSNRMTVHEREVSASVEKLFSDLKSLKTAVKKMREKLALQEAQKFIQRAKGKVIREIFVEKTHEEMRFLALNIIHRSDFAVLFGLKGKERGHLILASPEKLNIDMRELVPLVSPLINGKGGGNPSLVELVGESPENIDKALERAQQFIEEKI
ncbi:MAG: DHHA1 domain-containing protein [Candidatus Aminicenantes bacterium]